jgi:large subunit ribosomal protein L18
MAEKGPARLRRARKTRLKMREIEAVRLTVYRTNSHIYAQIIAPDGNQVLASASTLEKEVRGQVPNGGNVKAAAVVGQRIAEKAKRAGLESVAFDRSGYRYHGRVKALAEAARAGGLKF